MNCCLRKILYFKIFRYSCWKIGYLIKRVSSVNCRISNFPIKIFHQTSLMDSRLIRNPDLFWSCFILGHDIAFPYWAIDIFLEAAMALFQVLDYVDWWSLPSHSSTAYVPSNHLINPYFCAWVLISWTCCQNRGRILSYLQSKFRVDKEWNFIILQTF